MPRSGGLRPGARPGDRDAEAVVAVVAAVGDGGSGIGDRVERHGLPGQVPGVAVVLPRRGQDREVLRSRGRLVLRLRAPLVRGGEGVLVALLAALGVAGAEHLAAGAHGGGTVLLAPRGVVVEPPQGAFTLEPGTFLCALAGLVPPGLVNAVLMWSATAFSGAPALLLWTSGTR